MTTPFPRSLAAHAAAPARFSAHDTAPAPRLLNLAVKAALLSLVSAAPALAQQAAPPAAQLGEIVVSARQDQSRAGSKSVIGGEEIARRGGADMGSLVRYEPLVSAPVEASGGGSVWDGAGNTGYNIRGVEGNRVSLDVDGIALPDAAPKPDGNNMNSFGIGRDYFDPETLREVRIQSGTSATGASVPGLGGGVSFVTKSPEDYLGDGRDSYVAYKLGRNSANASTVHTLTGAARLGGLQALAVYVHRDGTENNSKGEAPRNPESWSSDALLSKWLWALAPGQKLDFTIDAYQRDNAREYKNKLSTLYPEGASQDSTTKRTRVSLGHGLSTAGPWFDTLESRLYVQDAKVEDVTDARYITGAQPYLRHINTGLYNKSVGLSMDAFKQAGAAHALGYGLSLEQTETRRPWREDRTVLASGAHQITMKNRMADMDALKLALHLRDEFSFDVAGRKAVLTPGLRGEYRKLSPKNLSQYAIAVPTAATEIRQTEETFVTPSISLSLEVAPGLDAYAQYNRGTRLPNVAERTGTYDSFSYTGAGNGYAVLGNANLKKETSNAFELGLKGTVVKGLDLRAALFHTKYENFIDYALQPNDPLNYPTITNGLYRPVNLAGVRTWGGEVALRADLGAWNPALSGYHADLAAGVTRGRSKNTITGLNQTLVSAAPAKASATLGYDHPQQLFGLALSAVAVDGKQAASDTFTAVSGPRFAVPGYGVLDFTAYWQLGKHAKFNIGIYNLCDRRYWDYASSRSLAVATSAATLATIERQAMPGRNVSASVTFNY